jgi:predicted site-specific integrase-resolvase
MEKRYLNTEEASEYTGIPVNTLRRWRYEGRAPIYTKPAGRALYDVRDLDKFLESGRRLPSVRAKGI